MARPDAADQEPDGAIVLRVLAGDVDAYEVLVERHTPRVRRLVSRGVPAAAAAETAHEAFVAAYLALPAYVATHPFENWLARIALRACADWWRERERRLARDDDQLDRAPDLRSENERDEREWCEWALARLDSDARSVLVLAHLEGLSVKECSDVLGWSQSKVKVRAHRARARLRRLLRAQLDGREART